MDEDATVSAEQRFVSINTLANIYDVKPRTIKNWTRTGVIPKPVRIGPNVTRYDLTACREAIAERSRSLQCVQDQ